MKIKGLLKHIFAEKKLNSNVSYHAMKFFFFVLAKETARDLQIIAQK